MAIKSGQLKEKTDYQAYILEMLRDENGYQVRPSDALNLAMAWTQSCCFPSLQQPSRKP